MFGVVMRAYRVFALLTGALAVLSSQPAAAEGYVKGFVCSDMPKPLDVQVELLDDAEPMLELRKALLAALEKRNARVSGGARLLLTLEAEASHQDVRRKGRDLFEIYDSTDEDTRFRMNLWSNRRDSVLGGRKDVVDRQGSDEIRVSITINDKTNGRCMWRGEAVHDTAGRDQWDVAEKLLPYVVEAIGRTVAHRVIEIH